MSNNPAVVAKEASQKDHGQKGVTVTTGTSPVTGNFMGVLILEDANFSAFSEDGAEGDAMTGFTVTAGSYIPGQITGYTLTSGKVRAYHA